MRVENDDDILLGNARRCERPIVLSFSLSICITSSYTIRVLYIKRATLLQLFILSIVVAVFKKHCFRDPMSITSRIDFLGAIRHPPDDER